SALPDDDRRARAGLNRLGPAAARRPGRAGGPLRARRALRRAVATADPRIEALWRLVSLVELGVTQADDRIVSAASRHRQCASKEWPELLLGLVLRTAERVGHRRASQ